jgi:hypothetical protein
MAVKNGFRPTLEQQQVSDHLVRGDSLLVNALAGTGKTTTLVYAAGQTKRRGLYLAFNRVIAEEANKRFGANVECMTVHALAQRSLPAAMRAKLAKDFIVPAGQIEEHLVRHCGIRRQEAAQYRRAVVQSLAGFFRSPAEQPTIETIPSTCRIDLEHLEPVVLDRALQSCWGSMADPCGDLPLSHSAYLKWFFLNGNIVGFDFILVDEAQDLGPVTIGIVKNAGLQTLWVGDRHQSIYQWNGAENALATIEGLEEVYISKSFRIGEARAELVSALLADLGEYRGIQGNPKVRTIVGRGHQPVRIVRNNLTLLAKYLQLAERNQVFVLSGIDKIRKLVRDAECLQRGRRVRTGPLSVFESWEAVLDRAGRRFGHPYTDFVRVIEDLGTGRALAMLDASATSAREATIILSTVHGAKGCEFDAVSIYDDFRGRKQESGLMTCMPAPVTRLLYVAVTRAKETLFMERSLSKRFNLAHLERREPVPSSTSPVILSPKPKSPDPGFAFGAARYDVPSQPSPLVPPRLPSVRVAKTPIDRRVRARTAYDRYGGFAIGIALGLFVAVALDLVGWISL